MGKLIDADKALSELKPITLEMEKSAMLLSDASLMMKNWICRQPSVDPIHAAGGCYCKECIYHEIEYYPDGKWEVCNDKEFWCNLHDITMPLNGFCSEGKNKNNLKEE